MDGPTPIEKAQTINNDFGLYTDKNPHNFRGAIAEIGAGQRVSSLFFEAYKTRKTVEKAMSAYGKKTSSAIYDGLDVAEEKTTGFTSRKRLERMLGHDYGLLVARAPVEDDVLPGCKTVYFCFANTVDIDRNGWAGVRVEVPVPSSGTRTAGRYADREIREVYDYYTHFNLLSDDKISKIYTCGLFGVNLIYAALSMSWGAVRAHTQIGQDSFVTSLFDGLEKKDLRIDSIVCKRMNTVTLKSDPESCQATEIKDTTMEDRSRRMCIDLVRHSSSRCGFFFKNGEDPEESVGSSTPTYLSFNIHKSSKDETKNRKRDAIVVTKASSSRSAEICDAVLLAAKARFQELLDARYRGELEYALRSAVHLPILSPDDYMNLDKVYINTDREKPYERENREYMLSHPDNRDRLENQLRSINDRGHLTMLSTFVESSELIKYVRSPLTRMGAVEEFSDFAYAYRSDQFVCMLVNIKNKIRDRDPVEIIGALVRRKTSIYIYPCTLRQLNSEASLYGID
ncbi:MAG: hypothetical protein AAGJ97_13050, partial [Planctomycetota bacterium]